MSRENELIEAERQEGGKIATNFIQFAINKKKERSDGETRTGMRKRLGLTREKLERLALIIAI